jgi:hypothetical protein
MILLDETVSRKISIEVILLFLYFAYSSEYQFRIDIFVSAHTQLHSAYNRSVNLATKQETICLLVQKQGEKIFWNSL